MIVVESSHYLGALATVTSEPPSMPKCANIFR